MELLEIAIEHIIGIARIPSFSTYEERLHPYIRKAMISAGTDEIETAGNNLIFRIPGRQSQYKLALAAHLDKINHYGWDYPENLPVRRSSNQLEGAMDDSAGLGILLALATYAKKLDPRPEIFFFFSEMEESKGLKEHPELLRNKGSGYSHGMGARRITETCLELEFIPDEVITVDTTPLFEGEPGIALYSKHWEYTELEPTSTLVEKTSQATMRFKEIDGDIHLSNNTNDYLHYGYGFNKKRDNDIVSLALEPAIYPYHQKGERVFIKDVKRVLEILTTYIETVSA